METKAGRAFLEEVRAEGRRVFVWTVNERETMKYGSLVRG